MKYAIIRYNGKQYKVSEGDVIKVSTQETSDSINFEVIMTSDGNTAKIGTPLVSGVSVSGKVLGEVLGEKIRVAKFKAKSNYHKVRGYRSTFKQVRIGAF